MEIGYNLPTNLLKKIGVEKIRVYFSGQNLLTLSKIKEIDPEETQGTDYPLPRVLNLGVTLTF
jgi:hypothetical protein